MRSTFKDVWNRPSRASCCPEMRKAGLGLALPSLAVWTVPAPVLGLSLPICTVGSGANRATSPEPPCSQHSNEPLTRPVWALQFIRQGHGAGTWQGAGDTRWRPPHPPWVSWSRQTGASCTPGTSTGHEGDRGHSAVPGKSLRGSWLSGNQRVGPGRGQVPPHVLCAHILPSPRGAQRAGSTCSATIRGGSTEAACL